MLRATTDLMVNILAGLLALGAVLAILRGGFGATGKIAIAVAAIVAVFLLKYFDAKFWGVVVMGGAVMILFVLPWLDRSPVKSIRYRPDWHKYRLRRLRRVLPRPRLPRLAAAVGDGQLRLAGRHAGLLRLLPADAVVEPHGHVQAGAEPRHVPRSLIVREMRLTMKKILLRLLVALGLASPALAAHANEAATRGTASRARR